MTARGRSCDAAETPDASHPWRPYPEVVRIRFRDCRIDTERFELTRGGEPVHLPLKAFRLLQILIERRPRAVSHQELYDHLWPGTFVQLSTLHKLLHDVRAALGDQGHDIVRTVYGFGFSFAADAVNESAVVSHADRW